MAPWPPLASGPAEGVGVRFEIEQHFDLPLDTVERALLDPGFVERMAELPKLGQPQLLTHRVAGAIVHSRIRYSFVGDLSPAVRAAVDPSRLTWVEDATTDRRTHSTVFVIKPDNYANLLTCKGTFVLSPSGTNTLRVGRGEITVSVPIVGKKVERAIISAMEGHARSEVGLVQQWAAGGGAQADRTHAVGGGQPSSKSMSKGAWSDGCLPLRAARSTMPQRTVLAKDAVTSTRSMRIPRWLWKSPAR